ncbi:hypothetical protein AB4Z17_03220 [Paenibacillus sp. TAF43_2]|uniref:hypothetical protein n=1 Tax=Paenibacillus sp. TAF43_2 TaxID=3233069 RepID=UPI003F990854
MSFLALTVLLIIGVIMLVVGFAAKKNWLKLLSIIPLAISTWHFSNLFLIGYG